MEQMKADSNDKHIVCSKCKMKYINDDDNIKTDFGYNRLNERYKKCVKCGKCNAEQEKNRKAETTRTGEHGCGGKPRCSPPPSGSTPNTTPCPAR